jgi:hypothetical protein
MPKYCVFLMSVTHNTCPDPLIFLDLTIMSCSVLLCNVRGSEKNSAVYLIFIRACCKLRVLGHLAGGQRELHYEEIRGLNLLPNTVR